MRLRSRAPWLALPAILAIVLSGCSSSGGSEGGNNTSGAAQPPASEAAPATGGSQVDQIYAAAKKEGKIVWYSSTPVNNLVENFQKAYPGIDIDFVRLPADQLATRYSKERSAGSSPADVITIASDQFIEEATNKKWLEPSLDVPAAADFPKKYMSNGTAITGVAPLGIAYNTNTVKNPPATWQEALNPKYKGKIQNGDPNGSPTYLLAALLWKKNYGADYLKKLASLDFKVQASESTAVQNIAAGAAQISLTGSQVFVNTVKDKGGPVGFKLMSPTTGPEFITGISTGADHPAGAKLLTNYLLSKEGQAELNRNQASPLGAISPDVIAIPKGFVHYPYTELDKQKSSLLKDLGLQ